MRKIITLICAAVMLLSLSACSNDSENRQNTAAGSDHTGETVFDDNSDDVTTGGTRYEQSAPPGEQARPAGSEPHITKEEENMQKLIIEVGGKTFTATLYDNETATALTQMLPLTLNMNELNGNEKYYYLDDTLPTDSQRPSGIKEGDIMLYGNSCLVLFYKSFSTSYSYTLIGRIDDTNGLESALGKSGIEVTFRLKSGSTYE